MEKPNKFRIVYCITFGYALMKWNDEALFWERCTKWYKYLGNLKRFNYEANEACIL